MLLHAQEEPIDGALAMALDEVLLEVAEEPVLRTWRWAETTLTIGCFVRLEEALEMRGAAGAAVPVVRRWTGGGCVTHDPAGDFSYSLVFPRGHPVERMRPMESYRWIHGRLAGVLASAGHRVGVTDTSAEIERHEGNFRDCFSSPVRFDLLDAASGVKISGAGQKRTRQGMLHQGNVRLGDVPADLPRLLAGALEKEPRWGRLAEGIQEAAIALREKKYASADWTAKY